MEARLKKERRKLFRRIILIMLGIWLVVSAAFCVVRLFIESKSIADKENVTMRSITNSVMLSTNTVELVLRNHMDLFYDTENNRSKFDSQLIITDQVTKEENLNTADKRALVFTLDPANNDSLDYYLSNNSPMVIAKDSLYQALNKINDKAIQEIKSYLNKKRDDGKYYELRCTKLLTSKYISSPVIEQPLELNLELVSGNGSGKQIDGHVETYTSPENPKSDADQTKYLVDDANCNIIPSGCFDDEYNKDWISELPEKQRKESSILIWQGGFNYLFYSAKRNVTSQITSVDNSGKRIDNQPYFVEYAKKINLLDTCKNELLTGVTVLFGFFLLLTAILCITTWKIKKLKILTEQQKLEITNALVHDVKTPLFVINGYAQCLKEDIDTQERELYIDKIMEQTDTANSLVCQMLDFSKLDSYQLKLQRTDFDLYELTANVLQNYTALPDDKRIVLTHTGGNTVNADKGLLKTVLQNLTDNAVKYALPNSVILIKINDAAFSIRNQAEPLTKEELKQLQEPYVHKDKSGKQKGSGLGLSIVRSILELHGSRLDISMTDNTFVCGFKL